MFNKTYPKFGFLEVPITMTAERPDSSYKHSPQKTTKSFAKVLDTHSFVDIITQQLSNSATQQLSNSATQQLRRKVCLRSEKRAAFYATKPYNTGIAFYILIPYTLYIWKMNCK